MRAIAWIGVLAFIAAWFLPAYKGQDILKATADAGKAISESGGPSDVKVGSSVKVDPAADSGLPAGPEWLPGWDAFRVAWKLLVKGPDEGKPDDAWKARVNGATSLTNALMILCILLLLGQRSGNPLMALVMLAACGLNFSWLYLNDAELRDLLQYGYYVWAGSFALVGLGLMGGREDDGYVVAPR